MIKIIYSHRFLEHDTGPFHPESPQRVQSIKNCLLNSAVAPRLVWSEPTERPDLLAWLELVHDPNYIQAVKSIADRGGGRLDEDTPVSKNSYQVALLAVSAWLDGVDSILRDGIPAFAIARPPGHHALRDRGMGFCIFNNAVIASRYALQKYGLSKVAILDWDVHHGNGTQELIWHDRRIAYVSTHQAPYYPGTGWQNETGDSANIMNLPLPSESDRETYEQVFDRFVIPFLYQFAPDLLIVSAGFDANGDDPLSGMELTPEDFGLFSQKCRQYFPRIMFGLEGGYALDSLAQSVLAVVANYGQGSAFT